MNLSRRRALRGILILVVVASIAQLAWLARSPVELTRIRNSLIAVPGSVDQADWPTEAPVSPTFKLENRDPPPFFVDVANRAGSADPSVDGLAAAIRIGEHLLSGAPWKGGAIKASSEEAYLKMIEQGRGYCADFTQVFTAIAHASNLPVREWGMSSGGFNGEGHAFNEIYDRSLGQWIFIDTHKSFYVVDAETKRPLSALEFRARLRSPSGIESLEIKPIVETQFRKEDDIIGFYMPAADQWFLIMGNNIYSYEANPLVIWAGRYSRAAEQIVAILLGLHPKILILQSESNTEQIAELVSIRWKFLIASMLLATGLVAGSVTLLKGLRRRREPCPV